MFYFCIIRQTVPYHIYLFLYYNLFCNIDPRCIYECYLRVDTIIYIIVEFRPTLLRTLQRISAKMSVGK